MRSIYPATLLALLYMGCAPVDMHITPISSHQFPRKVSNCEIQVLTQMPTDRKYEEVCIINAVSSFDLNGMLPSIKTKACELGADAIVVKNSTAPNPKAHAQAFLVVIKFIQ